MMHARESRFQRQEWALVLALLAVGCLIRLWAVTQPFVDHWSWRQADVAMIAENFYRHGFNIFHIPPNLVVTPRCLRHRLAIEQAFPHAGSSATPTI